jgi:5-methylcytosine-specific restriction protein B
MLPKLLLELAKKTPVIHTLSSNKPNWITKVEPDKLYVETEASREKYKAREKDSPWDIIPTEFLFTAWAEFISARKATSQEFIKTRGRSSFIMTFFSHLPFVDIVNDGKSIAIQLIEFQTDDLPCEQFDKVITFLDEIIIGKYNTIELSKQTEGNTYRIKSKARQDLRLLGILNEKHNINQELINQYIGETDKNKFLKSLMLHNSYIQIAIQVLDLLDEYSKTEKKTILSEMAMLIARNSRGDNLMVESVAKERTHNLLMWLETVGIINNNWSPLAELKNKRENENMGNFEDLYTKYLFFKQDPANDFYVDLRRYRAKQLRNFLIESNEITLQQFNEEVWNIGHAYLQGNKIDVFKLMKHEEYDLLKQLTDDLHSETLKYKGNAIWSSGSRVFGSQLKVSNEEKKHLISKAIGILNNQDLKPIEKVEQMLQIPGFGYNSASGLVMVFHPSEMAIYNSQSSLAIRQLGYSADTLEEFLTAIETIRDQLKLKDNIELDWFLYYLNTEQRSLKMSFWWVNQGQTHKEEKDGGFLWAPQQSKNGRTVAHHKDLTKAKIGDIVFCYSSGELKSIGIVEREAIQKEKPTAIESGNWHQDGYLVKLNYHDFTQSIRKIEIPEEWRIEESGPFDVNGDVKQGYFYSVSNEFVKQFLSTFKERLSAELLILMGMDLELEEEIIMSPKELTDHIHSYISSKGFYYEKEEVINLYLSLKSKPFVILSGISGTGKTKIIQWLAESIGATESKDNKQFKLISVRPDWNDGSDLLGYVDIKGEFQEGPLTMVIKEALKHPNLPYIVLLDEMNLARVEYYFSDILSVMESKKWENSQLVTSNLLSKEVAGFDLPLPSNLYICGTVNMDETTHPFSKKVLDRANTIEFNQINLSHFSFLHETEEKNPLQLNNSHLAGKYLYLKDVYEKHPTLVEQVANELVEVNQNLQSIGSHVGYRVRDEICFYLAYNEEGNLLSFNQAMDRCLLQKILPRLSGSDYRVQKVLEQLFKFCTNKVIQEEQEDFTEDIAFGRFPKSAEKIIEMRRRLLADGFTSFWISS